MIDKYEFGSIKIEKASYAIAMIIKANTLYREQTESHSDPKYRDLEGAKELYQKSHDISPVYDTWFGLGNIDRDNGDCTNALEKYKKARDLASFTKDIDGTISSCSGA